MWSRQKVALVTAIALAFLAHGQALLHGFTNWDDPYFYYENERLASACKAPFMTGLTMVLDPRPALEGRVVDWIPFRDLAAYMLARTVGLTGEAVHCLSLAFHLLTTAMVFLLCLEFSLGIGAAFFSAVFFGIHPVGVEVVHWAAELKTAMGVGLAMTSLFLYVRYSNSDRLDGRSLAIVVLVMVLACLSSQYGVLSAAWVVLYDISFRSGTTRKACVGTWSIVKDRWRAWLPLVATAAVFSIFHLMVRSASGVFSTWPAGTYAGTMARTVKALPLYLGNLLMPLWICPRHVIRPVSGATDPAFLAGAAIAAGTGLVLVLLSMKKGLHLFLLGTALTYILPTLNLFPSTVIAADRYLYLPAAMAGIAIASGGESLAGSRHDLSRAVLGVSIAYLVVMGGLTGASATAWRSSESLWRTVVQCSPSFFGAYHQLGMIRFERGDAADALPYFRKAAELAPENPITRNSLGDALHALGKIDEAQKEYEAALDLTGGTVPLVRSFGQRWKDAASERARALNGLGLCALWNGNPREAVDYFEQALSLERNNYVFKKNYERAVEAAERLGNRSGPSD